MREFQELEHFQALQQACRKHADPAIEEVKHVMQSVFSSTTSIAFTQANMALLDGIVAYSFKTDVHASIVSIARLPGMQQLAGQAQFVTCFLGAAKSVCAVYIPRALSKTRADRKITEEAVEKLKDFL